MPSPTTSGSRTGTGQPTTSDPYVPSADWADNQRLHQYEGGHNETYGGVTINIDNDYLDGATAFGAAVATPPPSLKVSPASNGAVTVAASWQGGIGLSSWLILGGTQPSSLSYVSHSRVKGALTTISEGSAYPYYEAEALGSSRPGPGDLGDGHDRTAPGPLRPQHLRPNQGTGGGAGRLLHGRGVQGGVADLRRSSADRAQ